MDKYGLIESRDLRRLWMKLAERKARRAAIGLERKLRTINPDLFVAAVLFFVLATLVIMLGALTLLFF